MMSEELKVSKCFPPTVIQIHIQQQISVLAARFLLLLLLCSLCLGNLRISPFTRLV